MPPNVSRWPVKGGEKEGEGEKKGERGHGGGKGKGGRKREKEGRFHPAIYLP